MKQTTSQTGFQGNRRLSRDISFKGFATRPSCGVAITGNFVLRYQVTEAPRYQDTEAPRYQVTDVWNSTFQWDRAVVRYVCIQC